MSTDPAVQAAIEAARAMQRRWHSDDTDAVCRDSEHSRMFADQLDAAIRWATVGAEPDDG